MRRIPLYRAELEVEGLAEKIRANSSIAYASPVVLTDSSEQIINKVLASHKTSASMDDIDLYYTKSVLVSTNWNKNDDVFDKGEVWAARNSPTHKRTNINHDEKQIVGHITDVYPIDNDGNVIAEDTSVEDLPDMYHLVNGAVIYKKWEDVTYEETVAELIEDIKNGDMYVSMEALFFNFAYAIIDKDGTYHVLDRNKDSAFLTKHLKAYGGTGEYDGCRIGRLLRNIVFSGKGYTKKPANENSIIIGQDEKIFAFSLAKQNDVFVKSENGVFTVASHSNNNDTQVENIMDEKEKKELDDKVSALTASVQALTQKVGDAEQKITELSAANDKLAKENADLQKNVSELAEAKTKAESELAEVKANELKAVRASKLVEKGYSKEDADKKVAIFASLTDEQFDVLVAELKASVDTKEENTEDKLADDANKALDNGVEKKDDVTLTVSAVEQQAKLEQSKAELRSAIASFLGLSTDETNEQ